MGCASLSVAIQPQATVAIGMQPQAQLEVSGSTSAAVEVGMQQQATIVVVPSLSAKVVVEMLPQAKIAIGQVCSVSDDELCVLAASDGPLRTKDGGYLLLDLEGEEE